MGWGPVVCHSELLPHSLSNQVRQTLESDSSCVCLAQESVVLGRFAPPLFSFLVPSYFTFTVFPVSLFEILWVLLV